MLLTKLKVAVGAVMVMVALGASGLVYRASGQSAPTAESATELDVLRKEVELLKVKMEVVQQKLRSHDTELRSLRTDKAGGANNRASAASSIPALKVELQGLRNSERELERRLKNWVEVNRSTPGSIPADTLMEIKEQHVKIASQVKVKEVELKQALKALRARDIDSAVKAWLSADDRDAEQRAVEVLEKAVKELREPEDNLRRPGK